MFTQLRRCVEKRRKTCRVEKKTNADVIRGIFRETWYFFLKVSVLSLFLPIAFLFSFFFSFFLALVTLFIYLLCPKILALLKNRLTYFLHEF